MHIMSTMKPFWMIGFTALALCGPAAAGTDKTLVSWVCLADTTQQGGSALTIQRGGQFDGVVFGERAPRKWMAGSDFFNRTPSDQQASTVETADDKTLIQMAIAYRDNRIGKIRGNTLELEVTFHSPTADEFGLDVLCDRNGENGIRLVVAPQSKTLRVGKVNAPFDLKKGEDLTLRVFLDKNLVEVFANDRQAAVTADKYIPENLAIQLFSKGGDSLVTQVRSW
jgi:hypothetical protein